MRRGFIMTGILAAMCGCTLCEKPMNSGEAKTVDAHQITLENNSRISFMVRFTGEDMLTFRTGRGGESFSFRRIGEGILWNYHDTAGVPVKKPLHFWYENVYYPNGRAAPSFSWDANLFNWSNFLRSGPPAESRDLEIAVEVSGEKCRLFLDHILLHEWPVELDFYGRKLQVVVPQNVTVSSARITPLPPENALYYPVDIASKLNVNTIGAAKVDGKSLPSRGREFKVKDIPFRLPEVAGEGFSHIDLSKSWFREGTLTSYEEPNKGSFGGRWGGALSGNPTRIQFRLPNRQYDAIYVLGVSDASIPGIPRFTAQFYRPNSGFPKNSPSASVPAFGRKAEVAVKTLGEKKGGLFLIKIPVEPGKLREFSDLDVIELELTKDVQIYRAHPDPVHHSMHGGGMPSQVQVFAMTLGISPIQVVFEPESLGNAWVEPDEPCYKVMLKNIDSKDHRMELVLETQSHDGTEKFGGKQTFDVPAGGSVATRFDLPLKKFGWHKVSLRVGDKSYERTLAIIRKREYKARPFDAKGFMFGAWPWRDMHAIVPGTGEKAAKLLGQLGIESLAFNAYEMLEDNPLARKYGMKSFWAAGGCREVATNAEEIFRNSVRTKSDVSEPVYFNLFAEPRGVGFGGTLPEFYGEKEIVMTADDQERFNEYKENIKLMRALAAKYAPGAKMLMPWGDPLFAVPFLQDPETRELFDGIAYDAGYFDRLPEQQMHQCSIHRYYMFKHYWNKFRKDPPVLITIEGPCISPVTPGGLTEDQQAAHDIRCALLLAAYGINRQFAFLGSFDCASYWGEQHYGGNGCFSRWNDPNPHVFYAAAGTIIRHLRHMEFVNWIPVGSTSVYVLQFKDSRNGRNLYVLWTIRGTREINVGGRFELYDSMDNMTFTEKGGFTIGQLPVYLYGKENMTFKLGKPDHSDSKLGVHNRLLGSAAQLFTRQTQDADDEYLNFHPASIRRFPAEMELTYAKTLKIKLPEQKVKRGVMPFYTALTPEKPILIPGKGKYLSLYVDAASDWGRVIYVLRDAQGEKWLGAGTKGTYNNDDTQGQTTFCFDGLRLLKFELPGNLPYDDFREVGSTWWGAYGGDSVVDYPLAIEKIYVERREDVMYVNSLEKASPQAVELGDLYVEYESAGDMAKTPLRIKMPPPPTNTAPRNPVKELAQTAKLPPSVITKVEQPKHYYDGTRGHFHFKEMPEAVRYDIYLALAPDGVNAIKLGANLKESGALVTGFKASTDFYAFVVYYDKDGENSIPSAPFKFKLVDTFEMK